MSADCINQWQNLGDRSGGTPDQHGGKRRAVRSDTHLRNPAFTLAKFDVNRTGIHFCSVAPAQRQRRAPSWAGNASVNTAPPPEAFAAVSVPPWRSTMP